MQIKSEEIFMQCLLTAQSISSEYLESKGNISIDDIKQMRHFPLTSEKGLEIVYKMIVAGICGYHDQLREKLLESGIDIGEMDLHSHDSLDLYFKSMSEEE